MTGARAYRNCCSIACSLSDHRYVMTQLGSQPESANTHHGNTAALATIDTRTLTHCGSREHPPGKCRSLWEAAARPSRRSCCKKSGTGSRQARAAAVVTAASTVEHTTSADVNTSSMPASTTHHKAALQKRVQNHSAACSRVAGLHLFASSVRRKRRKDIAAGDDGAISARSAAQIATKQYSCMKRPRHETQQLQRRRHGTCIHTPLAASDASMDAKPAALHSTRW